jgi:hydroxyacyl-ACP dehydratase HTD2-like protein with hotdog domain
MEFESVNVGDALPPLAKGPLTSAHLMRWSAAMENWHKIHYDQPYAVGHDKLPGLMVNGSLKQQFILTHLKNWAGLEGWVWKVRFQFRAMDVAGTTLRCWAEVVKKTRLDDFGIVELKLGIKNEADRESTPGTALIALPFRGGKPVPYPFVPPATEV